MLINVPNERIRGYHILMLLKPRRGQLTRQCMQNNHSRSGQLFLQRFEGANASNFAAPSLDAKRIVGEIFWIFVFVVDCGALVRISHVDYRVIPTLKNSEYVTIINSTEDQ